MKKTKTIPKLLKNRFDFLDSLNHNKVFEKKTKAFAHHFCCMKIIFSHERRTLSIQFENQRTNELFFECFHNNVCAVSNLEFNYYSILEDFYNAKTKWQNVNICENCRWNENAQKKERRERK